LTYLFNYKLRVFHRGEKLERVKTFWRDSPEEVTFVKTTLSAVPETRPKATTVRAFEVQALAQACWQAQGQPLQLLQSWALAGVDWEDIYLKGVVPAAQLLGDLSPTFLGQALHANNGLSALLICSPGSQHTMGVFVLSEFFRKSGWPVSGLALQGAFTAERCVQTDWFDVVGLCISSTRDLDSLGRLIRRLRQVSANPELKIMVALNRGLMLSLGADFIGGDARESQRLASQYVKKDPRRKAVYSYCNITIDSVTSMPRVTLMDPHSAQSMPTTLTNRWP
jgi:hypothetical protein